MRNMSAPSALFVLERAIKRGLRGATLLAAMGPGFTASFLALEGAAMMDATRCRRGRLADCVSGRATPGRTCLAQRNTTRLRAAARPVWRIALSGDGRAACAVGCLRFGPPVTIIRSSRAWFALSFCCRPVAVWVIAKSGPALDHPCDCPAGDGAGGASDPIALSSIPITCVVAMEIAVVPLALGLPILALDFLACQCGGAGLSEFACENRALQWASGAAVGSQALTPAALANGQPRR